MNQKRIWLLTGELGSGKSTALSKILLEVKTNGYTVGGVLTREIRSHGEREGFQIIDVSTEESDVLAQVAGVKGPRIGKYRINLNSLSTLAVKALRYAKERSDLITCDEVGPMELLSPEFRRAARDAVFESRKPCICVVHKRFTDPLIDELRASDEAVEVEVTYENRDEVSLDVGMQVIQLLSTKERVTN